jgi:hypothetical protein
MAQGMGKFTVSIDGGEKKLVSASRLDYIVIERELKQPIYKSIEQGYLEPVLRLAFQACKRQDAIPAELGFDGFLERCDVEFLTDDEDGDEGND